MNCFMSEIVARKYTALISKEEYISYMNSKKREHSDLRLSKSSSVSTSHAYVMRMNEPWEEEVKLSLQKIAETGIPNLFLYMGQQSDFDVNPFSRSRWALNLERIRPEHVGQPFVFYLCAMSACLLVLALELLWNYAHRTQTTRSSGAKSTATTEDISRKVQYLL